MLILIYLVCILSQPNRVRSNDYSDVRPIENSQKLMLRITTEMPYNLDSLFTTTETLTTIDNSIPKTSSYFGTHPLFPIQEQTTASMDPGQTTTPSLVYETTTDTSVIPYPEYTIPLENEFSIDETKIWQSTTESLRKETTPNSSHSEEQEEETGPSTSSDVTTMTTETPEIAFSSTDIPESDDLFRDNWPLKIDDSQIHPPDDNSFQLSDILEPSPDSIFLNDDNEFTATFAPAPIQESEMTLNSQEEIRTPSSTEEMNQSHEDFHNTKVNKNKALDTPSIFSPANLLNLFSMDHIPAMSKRKPVWWAKSRSTPEYAPPSLAKGRKRHTNVVHPIYESEEVNEPPRIFNRLFNRKLKDSVSFLEKFFGNLVTE